jgi:replication factor A1
MPAAPPQQQPHAPPHAQPAGGYGTGGAHPISPKHAYGNAYSGVTSYGQDRQQPSHAGMDQGPTRQFYQAQGGPTAKNQAPPQITPVKMLNPYQGRWTIEVRVTAVGSIKTFSKQGSTGRVQNYDVVDAHKDEIRCVAFNETIDHFSSLFEKGKTLRISKGSLVQANPKFNNLNTDYEIRLDKNSVVEEMSDQGSIPSMSFNFRSIADLEHTEVGVTIDIIGIATSARDAADIVRKDGSQTRKRDVTLVDNSGSGIDCTLWDRFADNEGGQIQERLNTEPKKPIVAIKACRVGSFGGTSLNSSANSVIVINPDLQARSSFRIHSVSSVRRKLLHFLTSSMCLLSAFPLSRRRSSWHHCKMLKTQEHGCLLGPAAVVVAQSALCRLSSSVAKPVRRVICQ